MRSDFERYAKEPRATWGEIVAIVVAVIAAAFILWISVPRDDVSEPSSTPLYDKAPGPQDTPHEVETDPAPRLASTAIRLHPMEVEEGLARAFLRSKLIGPVASAIDPRDGRMMDLIPVRDVCRVAVALGERPPSFVPVWSFLERRITIHGQDVGQVFLMWRTGYVRAQEGRPALGFDVAKVDGETLILGQ